MWFLHLFVPLSSYYANQEDMDKKKKIIEEQKYEPAPKCNQLSTGVVRYDLTNVDIESLIRTIRGQKVMIDFDLGMLYGVKTKRLNEQVKRNIKRFPDDFMFQLTQEEWDILRSQIVTAKQTENQTITLLRPQFATTKDISKIKCTRAFCKAHLDSAVYREKIQERSDETIANIAITLIHQCDVLIRGLIEWKKKDFLEKGGIKEEMYRARKDWQKRNGAYGAIPYDANGNSVERMKKN